jgi:hypothetical protein
MGAHGYLVGLLCITCSLAVGRTSASDLQPGILGSDDRRVIDQLSAPWAAIGQVNVTGYRRLKKCTGSLVVSNLVIAAAHCVMDPWRRRPFPLNQIHFWRVSEGQASSVIRLPSVSIFPLILRSLAFQKVPRRAFSRDQVLIVLKDELNALCSVVEEGPYEAGSRRPGW